MWSGWKNLNAACPRYSDNAGIGKVTRGWEPHMHDSYNANTEGCDKTCMRIDPEREHILGGVGVQPRTARHKSTPSIISATPPPTFDS